MAEEITGSAETDVAAKAPVPKKQRARRRQKSVAEAAGTAGLAKTARTPRGRRKGGDEIGQSIPAPKANQIHGKNTTKDAIKGRGRKRAPRVPEQAPEASPVSALDEMADLLQLEEENRRLRKALADKLRAENSDLRKRLGLDQSAGR